MPPPFVQADPAAVEARAREHLEEFLAARVAGSGAEGHVDVDVQSGIPLLYATTAGSPYDRYEIERVGAPSWPTAQMTFSVRLFADGGATEVRQTIGAFQGSFGMRANSTTENGRGVPLTSTSADGEVTVSAPGPWSMWWPEQSHLDDVGVWFGRSDRGFQYDTSIEFVDPVAYDAWCARNGGTPLLSAPADAATIAQQLLADPDFETTAPAATQIGGLDALSMDVALTPGGEGCGISLIEISRWVHSLQPGRRLRLYLLDLPAGMSVQTLAITVVAPEQEFDEVVAETQPIIESIAFHPGA